MLLGIVAGIVGVVGYIPYIWDIIRRKTKPDRASWLIWLIEYIALFVAQVRVGADNSLWLIGLQLIGVAAIALLSIRFGIGTLDRKSALLLAGVCATLVLWHFSDSATLAILLLLFVESIGVFLTARKVYRHPGSETISFWILISVAGALGVCAVGLHGAAILYAYPVALIGMGITVITASYWGARRLIGTPPADTV